MQIENNQMIIGYVPKTMQEERIKEDLLNLLMVS
jgi:hypothetical protein